MSAGSPLLFSPAPFNFATRTQKDTRILLPTRTSYRSDALAEIFQCLREHYQKIQVHYDTTGCAGGMCPYMAASLFQPRQPQANFIPNCEASSLLMDSMKLVLDDLKFWPIEFASQDKQEVLLLLLSSHPDLLPRLQKKRGIPL